MRPSNKPPSIILFDLDNTLFDPRSFRETIFKKIGNLYAKGARAKKITSICQEIYDDFIREFGFFHPDFFIKRLSAKIKESGQNKEVKKVIFDPKIIKDKIHKDTPSSLKAISGIGVIGIFSQGEKMFQHAKIASLKHLFHKDHIYVTEDKKSSMPKVFSNIKNYRIYFIDDILPMLNIAKKINPDVFTIWIKRGRYAEKQKEIPGFVPDATINNLKEVVELVKKNTEA